MRVVGSVIYIFHLRRSDVDRDWGHISRFSLTRSVDLLFYKGVGREKSRSKADRCVYLLEGGTERRLDCEEEGKDDGWEGSEHF